MQWWCAATGVPWEWSWTAYPGVWLFIAALGVGFTRVQARYGRPEDGRRPVWFFVALAVVWIALDWPVGALAAGYLSSMKMVQYLLLSLIASPLILIGLPRALYDRLMDSPAGPVIRVVTHPLSAMTIFVAIMAWTHWAPVVDSLMVSQLGSFFMDTIWIVAGLIFWWPVCAPRPDRAWMQDPGRIGYLIVATLVNTGVFAYLTFAELPLYAVYELAPPVTGLSTRDDQRLAGLLMKIGGAVILWTAITIIFFRWSTRDVGPDGRDRVAAGVSALFLLTMVAGCSPPSSGVSAEAAVIGRPLTPERAALYLVVENEGEAARELVEVKVVGAGRVSIHETTMSGGSMSMRPIESVVIPAGGRLEMAPGGIHVMLEEPVEGLFDVDDVPVALLFADGERVDATARIVALADLESALER